MCVWVCVSHNLTSLLSNTKFRCYGNTKKERKKERKKGQIIWKGTEIENSTK